jgi:hypothetical protein
MAGNPFECIIRKLSNNNINLMLKSHKIGWESDWLRMGEFSYITFLEQLWLGKRGKNEYFSIMIADPNNVLFWLEQLLTTYNEKNYEI